MYFSGGYWNILNCINVFWEVNIHVLFKCNSSFLPSCISNVSIKSCLEWKSVKCNRKTKNICNLLFVHKIFVSFRLHVDFNPVSWKSLFGFILAYFFLFCIPHSPYIFDILSMICRFSIPTNFKDKQGETNNYFLPIRIFSLLKNVQAIESG